LACDLFFSIGNKNGNKKAPELMFRGFLCTYVPVNPAVR
jgi:hypothetical protein